MSTSAPGRPDGRQLRWDRHNQERKQRIIDAAIAEIADNDPGAEFHVQQIAERAGLSRTVIYRHFTDRAELDREIQVAILDDLWALLLPAVSLDGTIPDIIHRIVGTYVTWAVENPSLHRIAEQDSLGDSPLQQGIEVIARQLVELIETAVDILGLDPPSEMRAALDPLVFALVGAVFSAVRRWVSRPVREPDAEVVVRLVTESVWYILDGHGRMLGIELDPDQPVEELLAIVEAEAEAGEPA